MKLAKLQVTNNYILIEPLHENYKTNSGLEKPEQYEDRTENGLVVKTTNIELPNPKTLKREIVALKKGTEIIFNKYAPLKSVIEGKEYLVLKAEDILGYEL